MHNIKVIEVITLFGFAREGSREPEHLFETAEARDTALSSANLFTISFASEMDMIVRLREPIDVTAIRTEDGRFFRLMEISSQILKK